MRFDLTVLRTLYSVLSPERERVPLWSPVAMGMGILGYFALEAEPPGWLGAVLLLVAVGVALLLRRSPVKLLAWGVVLLCLGFAAAQWRAASLYMPVLQQAQKFARVEGTVADIVIQEKGGKLVLSAPHIEAMPPEQTPTQLQVSLRALPPVHIGDRVSVRAMLFPLPEPTAPGAYDFARYLYFQGIGAVGYAPQAPAVDSATQEHGHWLTRFRLRVAQDMLARLGPETGAIAAALTVGEENAVPKAAKDALRDSGLYHILSISGVHLSIAAGLLFFGMRLALALYPPVGLRLPVKKIAAAFALVGTFFYLLAAGMPVPAQRSFIAVAFVLLAVLFDRQAISLRSLVFAAALILLVQPESLLGASFQMSFAATLAIVALYERYGSVLYRPQLPPLQRAAYWVVAVGLVSVVATVATAPFVITHFNRFQGWGVLANLLVEPLNAFVIMPGVVLSFLLRPIGLEGAGYYVLGWGIEGMMAVARFVGGLPYASVPVHAFSNVGFGVAVVGLLWLTLWGTRLRLLGIPMILAGAASMALHVSPDVLISGSGRDVMVRMEDGRYTPVAGTGHSFTAQAWLRAEAQEEVVPRKDVGVECDATRCSYRGVVAVKKPEALARACAEQANVLVAWWYLKRENCPGPHMLIGRAELEAHGAHTLWLNPPRVERVWEHGRGARPWEVAPVGMEGREED